MVIGIVAVLVAALVPAVVAARASAQRVQCGTNLRSLGQFVYLFAQDHKGRLPEAQNTPASGGGSIVPTWMYTKDYFALVDDYGANQRLFICPASRTADVGPSAFPYGEGSELEARTSLDLLPVDPKPVADGDPDLSIYWMGTDYQWMGRNVQETLAPGGTNPDGAPFEVTTLTRRTHTGTPVDTNPPIMADTVAYTTPGQNPVGIPPGYSFTHGRHWSIPQFDPTPSDQPWSRGTASAQVGDVRMNVLYRDGHVECKPPDRTAWFRVGTSYYFR